jgi:hypothetical protein
MASPVRPNPASVPMTDDGKGNRVPENIPLTPSQRTIVPGTRDDHNTGDNDGGIKARLPDNPPPKSPSPAKAKIAW